MLQVQNLSVAYGETLILRDVSLEVRPDEVVCLLILDEPTEGIQPNIIALIGQVLRTLKEAGKVSVLLVEQYFEFALKLADRYYVMEKGAIVLSGGSADLDRERIKPYLAF